MKLLIPLCALATSRQLKTDRQDEMFDHMDGGILDSKMGADVDKMTEEEKVEQLLEIVKKIDTNKDQFLEEGELRRWMQKTSDVSTQHVYKIFCSGKNESNFEVNNSTVDFTKVEFQQKPVKHHRNSIETTLIDLFFFHLFFILF